MKKRILSILLLCCMALTLFPTAALAADGEAALSPDTGSLCEHHPEHDEACGYTEGTAESPRFHEHTEECYILITRCVHEHTAECCPAGSASENAAGLSETENAAPTECIHECTGESGCITKELNCQYENKNGSIPKTAEMPQENEAKIAVLSGTQKTVTVESVQAMIDALPDAKNINDDNIEEVKIQFQAVVDAMNQLTVREQNELDISRYMKVSSVLYGPWRDFFNPIPGTDIEWMLSSNDDETLTLTITGQGEMPDFEDTGSQSCPWANSKYAIKKVIIREGVTNIGNYAFSGCAKLAEVHISKTVKEIGTAAFQNCSSLTQIDIPDRVNSVGSFAFVGCTGLKEVHTHWKSSDEINFGLFVFYEYGSSWPKDRIIYVPAGYKANFKSNPKGAWGAWNVQGENYTVSFDGGNASGSMKPVQTSGDYTLPDCGFTYETAVFEYWALENSDGKKAGGAGDVFPVTEDVTFYANWRLVIVIDPDPPIEVCIHEWGEWQSDSHEHWKKCSFCNVIDSGSRHSHDYSDDTDATCNTCGYERTITPPVSAEHTVTVTSGGNGTASASPSSAAAGMEITLTAAPNEGYHFKEWQVISGGVTIVNDKFTMPDGNVEVKAIFEKDAPPAPTEYTVTFDGNGGTPSVGSMTTAKQKLASLPTATHVGRYSFSGWYTKKIGGSKVTADTLFTDNTTVYAHWTYTGGGSSGGSDSVSTNYTITVRDTRNGDVSVSHRSASAGTTVTVTVKPDSGYELKDLTVTDTKDKSVKLTDKGNGKYAFTMPSSKVNVEASFAKAKDGNPFVDVKSGAYYEDAVNWAVGAGITGGISSSLFAPNQPCTRAQIVTFLWRASGSPVVNYAMDLADVDEDAYYAEAVRWALSQGITTGTGDGKFSPDAACTRAQAVAFLFRAAMANGLEAVTLADLISGFEDAASVPGYAVPAMNWALSQGIVKGSGTQLLPGGTCTRAQIVTFLYRAYHGT